ncbi:hypothetical protein [Umezawaea sp.]
MTVLEPPGPPRAPGRSPSAIPLAVGVLLLVVAWHRTRPVTGWRRCSGV